MTKKSKSHASGPIPNPGLPKIFLCKITKVDSSVDADGTAHQRKISGKGFTADFEAAVVKYAPTSPIDPTPMAVRDESIPITQPPPDDVSDTLFPISITVPLGTKVEDRDLGMFVGDTLVGIGPKVLTISQPPT